MKSENESEIKFARLWGIFCLPSAAACLPLFSKDGLERKKVSQVFATGNKTKVPPGKDERKVLVAHP